jgi:peptidoglycan hydrolase-like protein with peptidoglycan-binding domain
MSEVDMLIISPADQRPDSGAEGSAPTAPVFAGRTLRFELPFMVGDDVQLWQERLLTLGWTVVGIADGSFGPRTHTATRGFQSGSNLVVDGVVGPESWAAAWMTREP